jgi:glycine/D-amino acid oxidase-like deaminating enzyme/nitrite reductase/ring-hydroxylating ferredoxin subunit
MEPQTGTSLSLWAATSEVPRFPQLHNDVEVDICIVGGGITGLTAAYLLANEGMEVTIIDDGTIGGGESGRTTAHLSCVLDDSFHEMEKSIGKDKLKLAIQSHIEAIDAIEQIIKNEKIDCDFKRVDGYLFFKAGEPADDLERERDAAVRAGVSVEVSPGSPLESFNAYPCLKFPNQAQFHILKYLTALGKSITKNGGRIFNRTQISSIEDETRVKLETKNHFTIKAKQAIICTNSPISDYFAIHTKQVPYRSYAIAFEIENNYVPDSLYWDNEDPYHYIRVHREDEKNFLIIGGEDHKTGTENNPEERFDNLVQWSKEHFEKIGKAAYKWSGQILEPHDGLAFIGKDPENEKHVYIATGYSGNGLTYGTIAGIMFRDMLSGKKNPWTELYDTERKSFLETPAFIKEGAATIQKYLEYITPAEVNDVKEIKPGEGAIMREGLDKLAVYRDENGRLHKLSAVCTHLKCIVHWNSVEKSWDCPCHGSRFNALGRVINGPALSDLEKYVPALTHSKS